MLTIKISNQTLSINNPSYVLKKRGCHLLNFQQISWGKPHLLSMVLQYKSLFQVLLCTFASEKSEEKEEECMLKMGQKRICISLVLQEPSHIVIFQKKKDIMAQL